MRQEGMFHVLSINLFPALRHYWISRNFAKWDESVRKVPSSLFSSSLILLDISSGIQRIPSWTLDGEREVATEDEKFDSKAFFELHTSLCSLCLAPNFSSAILLQQRAGVTTEFSQSYVLQVWGEMKENDSWTSTLWGNELFRPRRSSVGGATGFLVLNSWHQPQERWFYEFGRNLTSNQVNRGLLNASTLIFHYSSF